MNDTIWQQIAATSWWTMVVFGLITYRSYQTTKPKIIPLAQLATAAIMFITASMCCVYLFAQLNKTTITWFSFMMLSGTIAGGLYYWRLNIICLHEEAKLLIPGSWLNPLLLVVLSTIIYLTDTPLPTNPDALMAKAYSATVTTFYGLVTGFVLGRFFYGMYLFRKTAPAH